MLDREAGSSGGAGELSEKMSKAGSDFQGRSTQDGLGHVQSPCGETRRDS